MSVKFDFTTGIISIVAPQVNVSMQELADAISEAEATPEAMGYDKVAVIEGKFDKGGGIFSEIIILLNPYWQLQFWAGSGVTKTSGGSLIGGVGDVPVKASGAAGDITLVQQPVDGTLAVSSVSITDQDKEEIAVDVWAHPTGDKLSRRVAYDHHVHINANEGTPGTDYDIGVHGNPSDNILDSLFIAARESLEELWVDEDLIVPTGVNLDLFRIKGSHATKSEITVTPGVSTDFTQFRDCILKGELDGWVTLRDMALEDVQGLECIAHNVMLTGALGLNGTKISHFLSCYSGAVDLATIPELSFEGSGKTCTFKDFHGAIKLTNKTGPEPVSITLSNGLIVVDSTVLDGDITVAGTGEVINNSLLEINTDYLVKPTKIDANLTLDDFISLQE